MSRSKLQRFPSFAIVVAVCFLLVWPFGNGQAQDANVESEIIANLAGGRVIVHVARDEIIVFGVINQPMEAGSIPPRVMDLDSGHIGILMGASEWRLPADPKPVRLDHDFQRIGGRDPRSTPGIGDAEPDLEAIGISFLERLRPLTSQLHHKLDIGSDEPLFEVVVIGYAPRHYGPEIWTIEYRIKQQPVGAREDYWQTQILRPRFEQLYPPEKHAPRTIVEALYPPNSKTPALMDLIQGNDPRIAKLGGGEPRFAKVVESVGKGQAQKAAPDDSADFLRALLPLLAGKNSFALGKMEEGRGISWLVEPQEPVDKAQKAKEEKERPPDAPTLRKRPNSN